MLSDIAEHTETTELDELHQLSEAAFFALQPAKNWLNNSSIPMLIIYKVRSLCLAHIITSLCSFLKRSTRCQPLIANHSLLVPIA